MKTNRQNSLGRRLRIIAGLTAVLVLAGLVGQVAAHNLQTKMVYMFFDPSTQACLDARVDKVLDPSIVLPAGCAPLPVDWVPGDPALLVNDEIGMILKVVPRDGTSTGVGGHIDFYVPNGVTVTDAAYVLPDGSGGYENVPMKGQALIAIGDGPVGAKVTPELIGLGPVGPNINGVTTDPVVFSTGLHRGTVAGVYGDTGIFYATDPDTAYGSWQRFTGDATLSDIPVCGVDGTALTAGEFLTNNSGDEVIPCNKWDAGQLFAWGVKGTTCTEPGCTSAPIVDYPDGRGNTPWGFGSGVAGPQSGYAWHFDWDEWAASTKTAADMRAAMSNDSVGPWKRIKYPGSRASFDQPGLVSSEIGLTSIDAASLGIAPNALPATLSQTDTTSPKAVRWAVGQLTINVPEYAFVKIKINNPGAVTNEDGCPRFHGDTFGGDAGGDNNGKDHLWRYYEPTLVTVNACALSGKLSSEAGIEVGQTFQFKVKVYNLGDLTLTNVLVTDTLPSGVSFVSAFPSQNSGPNPLVWNLGTLLPGEQFESIVTVEATGSGLIENIMCVTSDQFPVPECTAEVISDVPVLKQSKTVSKTSVAPGEDVQYTITIENIGSAATSTPITINEHLKAGITYVSLDSVVVNGASYTALTAVDSTDLQNPDFTVPAAIQGGQELVLKFTAHVSDTANAGTYCNSFTSWQDNDLPLTIGSAACFSVGGAKIGDTIFRDWNGDGIQNAVDEGAAGVTVELWKWNGAAYALALTTTTNTNGNFLFEGLTADDYQVRVSDTGGKLTGYTPTADPDGGTVNQSTVILADGEQNLQQDFGYQPAGGGVIGDTVWADNGPGTTADGVKDGTELGIDNVTVWLYADSNGNGSIDSGDALVATKVTSGGGIYNFSGLAVDLNYIVQLDQADPDLAAGVSGTGVLAASTPTLQTVELVFPDTVFYVDADFGFYRVGPATIGDTVFEDVDGNGIYDSGTDVPLANIDVFLFQDLNGNSAVDEGEPLLETTSTDVDGLYQFTNISPGVSDLVPGDYVVVVNGQDPDLPGGLSPAVNSIAVSVVSDETNNTIDFPFTQLLTKAVYNVTQMGPGTTAIAGDVLEYTLTPGYTGGQLLKDFTVSDATPTGTTYAGNDVPASTSEPAIGGTGTVAWNLGSNTPDVPGVLVMCPVTALLSATQDASIKADGSFEDNNDLKTKGTGDLKEALIQFDVSAIPFNSIINSADLSLFVNSAEAGASDAVHRMLTSWTEATGSWVSMRPVSGTDYVAASAGSYAPITTGAKTLDIKTVVNDWVNNGASNNGIILVRAAATGEVKYNSSENGANNPQLVVRYLAPTAGGCSIQTDGMVIYDNNANAPVYQTYIGSTGVFNTPISAPALADKARVMAMASAPDRDERIVAGVLNNKDVVGEIWNGSTWSYIPNPPASTATGKLGVTTKNNTYGATVAYEQQSGDAMVVWDDNAQAVGSKLRYSIWNNATWTAAASIGAYLGVEPVYTRMAANPKTDRMVLVVNDTNYDDYALVWNGTTWGSALSLDTSGLGDFEGGALNVAYERTSGRAMVVYGKNGNANVYYRIFNGTGWTAESSVTPPTGIPADEVNWLVVGSDPNSNRIGLGVLNDAKDVWFAVWDGSSWGDKVLATTGAETEKTPDLAVAFESFSGQALAVYAESKNVRYRTWSASGWSAELTGPELPNNGRTFTLDADPNSDAAMLTALSSDKAVSSSRWSGSTWGALILQTDDSGYSDGQTFAYNYRQDEVAQTATNTTISATPTVFTDNGSGTTATVTITINSTFNGTVTGVPLVSAVTGGVLVGACTGPLPVVPQPLVAATPLVFTYTCPVTATSSNGTVTFSVTPTGTGVGILFEKGSSNSIIGTPPLKYRVTVTGAVSPLLNTASIFSTEAQQLTPNSCSAIAGSTDGINDTDALFAWDLNDATATPIGTGTGTTRAQAAAWNANYTLIYSTKRDTVVAAGSDLFGTVNPADGLFSAYSGVQGGTCDGRVACATNPLSAVALPTISVLNIVGMSFDPLTGILYAVHRRNAVATDLDVLLKINPVTGQHVEDAFGTGVDYVQVATGTLALYDIDDIAFHPVTGELFAVANSTAAVAGTSDRLIKINKTDGAVTDITRLTRLTGGNLDNMQGLSFENAPSGVVLYGSTGKDGLAGTNSSLFQINTATGVATKISLAPSPYADVEALACEPGEFSSDPIIPLSNSNEVTTTLPTGSIGDLVWWDYNADGVRQPNGVDGIPGNEDDEIGIATAFVNVYLDSNGNGTFEIGIDYQVALGVTDANGAYSVTGLPANTYFVDVYEDSITTDGVRNIVPTTGDVQKWIITCTTSCNDVSEADFGYVEAALVKGSVYFDINHDGNLQINGPDGDPLTTADNEPGLAGITVTLTGTDFLGEPVSMTVDTDAAGNYQFIMPPGDYTVTYNTAQTSAYPDATTPTSVFFTAEPGVDHEYIFEFGVDNSGRIGNRIWNDADGDGTQNAGELGIAGVTMQIYLDTDGDPVTTGDQTYVETTVTSGNGSYEFIGLPDTTGSQVFVVKVDTTTLPPGYTETGEGTLALPNGTPCGPLPGGCDDQIATALSGGETISWADLGYLNSSSYPLSGVVWNDGVGGVIGDGIKQAGESGIENVTVSLITIGIIDGYVDVNGDGLITAADDGTYFGFTVTDGEIYSGGVLLNGLANGIVVINGRLDIDGNGVLSASDDKPATVFGTTVTTGTDPAGGIYNFPGVPNGEYLVKTTTITLPSTAFVGTGEGNSPGAPCGSACDSTVQVRVNGASPIDQYFGYQENVGSLIGTICTGTGDGFCDAPEVGVIGVIVYLTYAGTDGILGTGDDVVVTTTTDANGDYTFNATTITSGSLDTGLPPGFYQVTKTNPANTASLADADGGNPSSISVNLTIGQNVIDRDFELQPVPGGIGDLVWLDTDRDGVYDIGEPGLANVSVELAPAYTVTDGFIDINGGGIDATDDGWLRGIQLIDGQLDMSGNGSIGAEDTGTFFGTPVFNGLLDLNGGGTGDGYGSGYTGGDTLATEITDMQGSYLFTDVPAGNYLVLVNESTLSGAPGSLTETAGTTNASSLVTVTAGATNLDVDFGYVGDSLKATIGNFVWSDADDNGLQDDGEPGIGGVTLRLLNDSGVAVDDPHQAGTQDWVATTAADGSYYFFGADPGKYKVEVTDDFSVLSGYTLTDGPQSSTDPTAAITVAAGAIYDKADFGYYNPALYSITDRAWYDANRNGMIDNGESGIGGLTVNLVIDENADGIVNYDVIAGRIDVNGDAKISTADDAATLGGYTIIDGFVDLSGNGSIGAEDDSATYGTYKGYSVIDGIIDVSGGGTVPPNTGRIGDLVWLDANGDGLKSVNDPGLPGVTVYIDANDSGVLDWADGNGNGTWDPGEGEQWIDTDASGSYLLEGLDAGSYNVKTLASTLPTSLTVITAPINPVSLLTGQTYTSADFGYKPTGTTAIIGDRLWSDNDGDGIQDTGEAGIVGVSVNLLTIGVINGRLDIDGDGSGTASSPDTDDDGSYAGHIVSDGLLRTADGTTLLTGVSVPVYIGGSWVNRNVIDGAIDTDASGGVTVFDNVSSTFIATKTTEANGSYLFTNVTAGTYVVAVASSPAGYTQTYGLDGTTIPNRAIATVGAGEVKLNVDFGYQITSATSRGVIGNTVFEDLNGNGVLDAGEEGIAGVTLNIYSDPNQDGNPADGVLIATVSTDVNGNYSFSGLPVSAGGSGYVVEVSDTKSVLGNAYQTADPDEASTCLTCNYRGSAVLYPTGTSTGPVDNMVDFGFYTEDNSTISPEPVIASVISDPDGSFVFDGLEDDDYVISISDNTGELSNLQGTTVQAQAGAHGVTIAGADVQGIHFGYAGLGPIGDRVWSDANGNGIQDENESGIGGVTVELYFDDGDGIFNVGDTLIATTTTDAAGNYEFNDLPAGTFFVEVTPPGGGYLQTGDPDGCTGPDVCTTPHLAAVTLTSTSPSYLEADFGYQNSSLADVSGKVWRDFNKNAVIDSGEPVFTGVTVALLDGSGNVVATTTTDGSGNYSFPDVPAGSYSVLVTDEHDKLNGFFITSGLDEIPVTITGTTSVTDVDFGYARQSGTGSIGDTLWLDANGDGVQGANESGLPGVTVYLCLSFPCTTGPTSTVTGPNGRYLFPGLSAGTYYVGYDSASLPGATGDLVETTYPVGVNPSGAISLSDGEAYLQTDFGFEPKTGTVALGDKVWYDTDGDGLQDPGEVGIGGVSILVFDVTTGAVVATIVTNPDGSWLATGLPAGNSYIVTTDDATLPEGVINTPTNMGGGDTYITPVLLAGTVLTSLDFGFNGGVSGAIGDSIWLDADGDGLRDPGESGLPNLGVRLIAVGADGLIGTADDFRAASTSTDSNGEYLFTGLQPGVEYYVEIATDLSGGLAATPDTGTTGAGSNAALGRTGIITLTGGEFYSAADFGYVPTSGKAVIGDRIWSDANGDGVQDPGEAGIGGVTVELQSAGCTAGVNCPTTTTAADGSYLFTNVPAGADTTYVVKTTTPTGYTQTGDPDDPATVCGDGGGTGAPCDGQFSVTVGPTAVGGTSPLYTVISADFGYYDPNNAAGVIGDTIYLDSNGDGDCELSIGVCTEAGIDGVTLDLWTIGVISGSIDINGDGVANDLDDGSYAGYAVINGKLDINADGKVLGDVGYVADSDNGTVYGYAVIDGRLDIDGIGGIDAADKLAVKRIATTETAGGGLYQFSGLVAGDYRAEVSDTGNLLNGMTETQTAPLALTIVCASGCTTIDDADFGYAQNTTSGSISDEVFIDANGNGSWDEGEGVSSVTVNLYDPGPDGVIGGGDDTLIATTTTNAGGKYVFAGLPPGNYYVDLDETTLPAAGVGLALIGGATDPTSIIPLGTSENYLLADFGYQPASGNAVIGDRIWSDVNADGVQNAGEPGLGGVTVSLTPPSGGNAGCGIDVVCTTTTAADGSYLFTNVPAGADTTYVVAVTTPTGYTQTGDPDDPATVCGDGGGTGAPCDGQFSVTVGPTAPLYVVITADFGYQNTDNTAGGSIGDTLYRDTNGDGDCELNLGVCTEPGIAGVTVSLFDNGGNLVASTTTDATGNYTFNGLPAGDYTVVVTDIGGVLDGLYTTQSGGTVTLGLNEDYTNAVFGFAQGTATGSIGDTVYFDSDGNGVKDAGDFGISGVTLNLIEAGPDGVLGNSDDVLVNSTATNSTGTYLFDGLSEGKYKVVVTDQNNVVNDLISTESAQSPILISCATSCTNVADADFGYKPTVGGVGNIGGSIWRDTINPGVAELETGEPRISGVLVELWLDNDLNGTIEPGIDNLVRTTITDANGDYNFLGLPPADYIVRVPDDVTVDVAGNLATNNVLLGMDRITHATDANADGNGHLNSYLVSLSAGETNTSVDFAYRAPAGVAYDISGMVYEDADGEGGAYISGTDATVPGATVTLYRVVGGIQYLADTTTTNSNGDYSFIGLPAGVYVVKVNTDGTVVDGFDQTVDPDATLDSQHTVTVGPDATGINFAYWNGGVVTTPVTLSYFESQPGENPGEVNFNWGTSTEAGNVGFDLYELTAKGKWRRINDKLIPSQSVLPIEWLHYSYFASGIRGTTFKVVDTDILGKEVSHGPFELGTVNGVRDNVRTLIDHDAIKKEHDVKAKVKKQRKMKKMKEKQEKQKQKLQQKGDWTTHKDTGPNWATRLAGSVLSVLVASAQAAELPLADTGLMRIEVEQAGVQRVTYEDLVTAGLDLNGIKPGVIALTNRGEPVPLFVQAAGKSKKATFGPGAYFEFIGEPLDTLYTSTNVYNFYLDKSLAASIEGDGSKAKKKAVPAPYYLETVRVEDDKFYGWASPTDNPWYMGKYLAESPVTVNWGITVDHYAGPVGPVSLNVGIWGYNDWPDGGPDHHVRVSLNGQELLDEEWDGIVDLDASATVPDGLLQEGANTVTFDIPVDNGHAWDQVVLDRYAVTYPRLFQAIGGNRLHFTAAGKVFKVDGLDSADVVVYRRESNGSVARMEKVKTSDAPDGSFSASFAGIGEEASYFVTTVDAVAVPGLEPQVEHVDITSTTASYLVIAHSDFIGPDNQNIDSLTDLVLERQTDGHSVLIVDVEQVYARFGAGVVSPHAIKDYIAYAYHNMGTEMVLLVGADTLDYLGNYDWYTGGNGQPVFDAVSFIPSLYAQTGPIVSYAPVDPLYADVDNDMSPDLAIGRFPVRNSAELRQMVDKTLAWEQRSYSFKSLFIADKFDVGNEYDFKTDAEDMLTRLPAAWQTDVTRAYLDDASSVSTASTLIKNTINAGVALTSFVGHSDISIWTFDGLFSGADARNLTNVLEPTIVTQWGCWNTWYVTPVENTMGHEFLLNGPQGAAAILGASTLTEAVHERNLGKKLYNHLFQPGMTLGRAVQLAKEDYAALYSAHPDVILGWNLLGDPGLVVESGN